MSNGGLAAGRAVRVGWACLLVFVVGGTLGIAAIGRDQASHAVGPVQGTPWKSSVENGQFELALGATKATFASNETLDVVASLTYLGPDERAVIGSDAWGPVEFLTNGTGAHVLPSSRGGCTEIDIDRGVSLNENLLDLEGQPHPFRVAHGMHEIDAFAAFRAGGCHGPASNLRTTIVVAVRDGPDDIPLFTNVDAGGGVCLLMRNGAQLVQSSTGLGVIDFRGNMRDVVWPNGYSARRTADGAVLLGREGQVIAHEGYRLVFDAIDHGGPLRPCADVEVELPTTP